ncbi:hypothetical protein Tco_0701615 [Tanacetum coccineum]
MEEFRLSKVVGKIVIHEQIAFIANRQILDIPLILSEAIDLYKKRKKKMMLFKVDFEKAFDSVSWSPTSEFNVRRGSRQGDPLSPFLFIIIMGGLHMALKDSVRNGLIRGINIALGLKINIHKSSIYSIGVSSEDILLMASNTGCSAGFDDDDVLGVLSLDSSMNELIIVMGLNMDDYDANVIMRRRYSLDKAYDVEA